VLACAVAGRRREIGVRAALGADARAIRGFVLRQGLRPVAVGVAVGGMVALAAVAGVACLLPAARAARVDPAQALRLD
jgi:ABC-type antimicrobial peptide transport system permease subunit